MAAYFVIFEFISLIDLQDKIDTLFKVSEVTINLLNLFCNNYVLQFVLQKGKTLLWVKTLRKKRK